MRVGVMLGVQPGGALAPACAVVLCREERGGFGRLSRGTERFRTPAGARVTSLCWPKEK